MLALIPGSLAWILSGALRSLGHARTPWSPPSSPSSSRVCWRTASCSASAPPATGVVGAAWALVFANILKTALLAYQIYGPRHLAALTLPARDAWRSIAAPLLTISAPIAFTEFAWSLGGFLYAAVYARVGTAALAASQIVGTLEGIFIVGSFGLMSAATVFIGRSWAPGTPPPRSCGWGASAAPDSSPDWASGCCTP